jgi:hypothetical protein
LILAQDKRSAVLGERQYSPHSPVGTLRNPYTEHVSRSAGDHAAGGFAPGGSGAGMGLGALSMLLCAENWYCLNSVLHLEALD